MMTLMTVIHAPLISDGALSGLKAVYSPVSVKSFSEILLSPWLMFIDRRWDTECYCGVRYFQLSQLVELRRIRSAIFPPNEKASCAEYVAPGFCCITSAALLPKSLGSPFGLTVVANIMHFGGLSMSVTSVAYSGDTENYDLIHCPFTNRHETALLPYPISNTTPYASLVLNASPRTALPYPPEGTTMNVGQLRPI